MFFGIQFPINPIIQKKIIPNCWIFFLVIFNDLPGIPTTIKTMGVNITTIVYLRVLIIQIGSTIVLMVVEAQGSDC